MGILDLFKKKKKSGNQKQNRDISEPGRISALLDTLAEENSSCTMLIGNETFSSMILGTSQTEFYTDLMIPLASNSLLSPGQGLRISILHDGTPYQMYCTYQGRKRDEHFETLSFLKPSRIIFVERRQTKRVKPEDEKGVRILFDLGVSSLPNAEIVNISETGLAIRSPLTEKMRVGSVLDRMDIILPNNDWISCKGVVRRIRGELIGIELVDLSLKQKSALTEFMEKKES